MAAGAVGGCSAFDALVRPPVSARGAAAYAHALNLSRRTAIRRRVYSCVLFGFELEMLRLHMRSEMHGRCRSLASERFPNYKAVEAASGSGLKKMCAVRPQRG